VIVPFDICSMDSTITSSDSASGSLVAGVSQLAKGYLSEPGPARDAAAVCLANLLKRPDMEVGRCSVVLFHRSMRDLF